MANRKLVIFSNTGDFNAIQSASETVDFLSVKVGASGLEMKESAGHFDFGSKKLTKVADGTAADHAATKGQLDAGLAAKVDAAKVGVANGIVPTDSGNKIPVEFLPNTVMEYKGAFDPNSSTLANGVGDNGDVYRASAAGTYDFGAGPLTFALGDFAIYNGSIYEHSPAGDAVVSVNGKQGVVVLTTTDLAEGDKLFFTDARALSAAVQSGAITEGVLKAPTHDAVKAALDLKANASEVVKTVNGKTPTAGAVTLSSDDISEGATNKYYSDEKVDDRVADLIQVGSNLTKVYDDTNGVLTLDAKVQKPEITVANASGADIAAEKVVLVSAAGEITLAQANQEGLDNATFAILESSISNGSPGLANLGPYIVNVAGVVAGAWYFLSAAAPGALVTDASVFGAGDSVIRVGRGVAAGKLKFDPKFVIKIVS